MPEPPPVMKIVFPVKFITFAPIFLRTCSVFEYEYSAYACVAGFSVDRWRLALPVIKAPEVRARDPAGSLVMNRSVRYDEKGGTRMQELLNHLVRYRILLIWDARRTLAERRCWRRPFQCSGSGDFPTPAFRIWNE